MFPSPADELALHERLLSGDPIASADVFESFMEPLLGVLRMDLGCEGDKAYDSAVDAVFAYLNEPEHYDRTAGRLCTYLTRIAKNKAIDRLRSSTSSRARDTVFAEIVEVGRSNPKAQLEDAVQARELWDRIEEAVTDAHDRDALKLIFEGESATEKLAVALGLDALPLAAQRHQVKRERDRLIKMLERLGKKLSDEQP